jgi:uncharacterized membrane protein YdjX (TVP38/TMEM64 family)
MRWAHPSSPRISTKAMHNLDDGDIRTESNSHLTQRLLPVLLVLVILIGGVWLWYIGFLQNLLNEDCLIRELRQDGVRGPLLCVAAQFVQVVIFAIPGEVTQLAAGYVFGLWRGFLYSVFGITLGSVFNFYFARVVGRPALERFISRKTLDRVGGLLNNARGKSALFLLFLLPGAPKDVLCYGAGFTGMTATEFVVISSLARTPALFASILIGARAAQRDYDAAILTGVVLLVVAACFYLYERHRMQTVAPSATLRGEKN